MVSSETRDRIVENCLRIQLGDHALDAQACTPTCGSSSSAPPSGVTT